MSIRKAVAGILLTAALGFAAFAPINPFNFLSADPILSGIRLSEISPSSLGSLLKQNPAKKEIKIKGNGSSDVLKAEEFVINPIEDDQTFQKIMVRKLLSSPPPLDRKSETLPVVHVDDDKLKRSVLKLDCFTGESFEEALDAKVIWNGYSSEIIKETVGNEPDVDKMMKKVLSILPTEKKSINLKQEKLYKRPKLYSDSKEILKAREKLDQASQAEIIFQAGWYEPIIHSYELADLLGTNDKSEVILDERELLQILKDIKEDYGFYASKEEALSNKRIMDGYLFDPKEMLPTVMKSILKGERKVIELKDFEVTGADVSKLLRENHAKKLAELTKKHDGTFIYISIDDQFLWFYKNGEEIIATSVTTGTKDVYDTPTGEFELEGKSENVTLKGRNADGSKYSSHVQYWLPFDGPLFGIHDASWRWTYGGDEYIWGGSHGCVNTPYDAMETIYEEIDVGTAVVLE